MRTVRRALIAGGGVAGPALGMALLKAGIEPVAFEARATPADPGVFLTLASNGVDALRTLGADEPALAVAFPTPAITLRSGTGKRLGETSTGGVLADGTTSQTLKRSDLHRALHAEATSRGVAIEHGRRIVTAEDTGDGVRVGFADGSEEDGDVLIGCDGVHSTVRRIIDPAAPAPTYTGLLGTGGFTCSAPPAGAPGHYEMVFGKRAFFGHVQAPGGATWWFANVPHPAEPSPERPIALDPASWRDRLMELFREDSGPATALIQTPEGFAELSPSHVLPHLPRWQRGRMALIGDAAHAPSPSSGQGASLAIEDAVVLARCLRDEQQPATAFARFEHARRKRAEHIIKWAARTNSAKAPGPVGRLLRDATLPLVLKLAANSKAQRAIYDHHIDWDAPA